MKSLRQVIKILDAKLALGTVMIKTTRECLNNPKFLDAIDSIQEAALEAFSNNAEEIAKAEKEFEAAQAGMTVEEYEAAEAEKAKRFEEQMADLKKSKEDFEKVFKDLNEMKKQ